MQFDEDVFHLTLLKVLEKDRLHDMSDQGILNYIFKSFRTNSLREMQYPYVARRVITDNPPDLSDSDADTEERLEQDALNDYVATVILLAVELAFSPDHNLAFKLKVMSQLTYRDLEAKTGLVKSRQLVKECREWVSANVDRDMVKDCFYKGMDAMECAQMIVDASEYVYE